MTITASAPGKVILFGEHFVVKGTRSIVTAIPLRVKVTITTTDNQSKIKFKSPIAGVDAWIDTTSLEYGDKRLAPIARLLEYLKLRKGYEIVPHTVIVDSKLPVGAGLGSSASLSVAYALAYTAFYGSPLSRDELLEVSFEAEKVAHGKPSGIDNTIAVYGGSLVYRKGSTPVKVDLKLPPEYLLIVADTGVPRVTREVVHHVLSVAESTWKASSHIYRAADIIIDEALEALFKGDPHKLGVLMNINQGLLNAMGASSRIIEEIVFSMRSSGAIGAKLTGAGWGGAVIGLVHKDRVEDVVRAISPMVKSVFSLNIGAEGARLDSEG